MGRLVRIPKQVNVDLSISGVVESMLNPGLGGLQPQPKTMISEDSYLERVAKYVPAEILAFSVFINAILDQAMKTGGKFALMAGMPVSTISLIALFAGAIATPFFIWYVREDGDAWITNAIMATLAYPFWAYALGAVAFNDVRDGNLAAILLASFTVFSGLVTPRVPRPKRPAKPAALPSADGGPRLVEPLAS